MEDVEKEGVGEGIDVRGLVSWDDGLTRGERERMVQAAMKAAAVGQDAGGGDDASPVVARGDLGDEELVEEPRRERRKVKKWLGIW